MTFKIAELPSRGILTDGTFTDLIISKVRLEHLTLFSRAVTNKNPAIFAEGIASLINIPLEQLTISDFYAVVTYLRCTSFKHTPLALSWTCDGYWYTKKDSNDLIKAPAARQLIEQDTEEHVHLVPHSCGHTNSQTFEYDDLAKVYLPDSVDIDTENFAVPNAGLYAEYSRLVTDPSMAQILPALQWIKHGKTLADKLEWIKSQGDRDLELFDQASRYNEMYTHGISNSLIGTCEKCGTQVIQKFELTAESFFRGT